MAGLAPLSQKMLGTLVNRDLLSGPMIEGARRQFGAGANRHLVLDQVLLPHLLVPLRRVAAVEGDFEDNLKLKSGALADKKDAGARPRGAVSAQAFAQAEEDDRFIRQRKLAGPKPEFANSSAIKVENFIRTMFESAPMHEWLSAMTGLSICQTGGINLKLHGPADYLKKHSDARRGRKLCMVLYLHEAWQRDYAGRFLLHRANNTVKAIDPLPNRLVMFDVTQENFHEIEPLGAVPDGWQRINYSAWMA